ncbi:MAG: chromosome segregation protein SMC [Chloroflexi bacterium]|nr:chromosome segregation protein SMC [Chloroflexota bacterium]
MFLRRLELKGFKSFARPTQFEFDRGVTVIVGPNGSGKSNVADGLRWVLGEQNARNLRARRMEDIIFTGSSQRTPLGMAEASLDLDNSREELPLEFTDVTLTRRAYRSGESEYFINRGRTRWRDVAELLLKANVGQNGYTIIGQGVIENFINLRPEEKRLWLEEAADVKRHRMRLAEARERLRSTESNLERVSIIVSEIAPRLNHLQHQARQAQEYQRLSADLEQSLKLWYGYQWWVAQRALLRAESTLAERRHQIGVLQRELSRCQGRRVEQQHLLEQAKGEARELEERTEFLEKKQQRLAQSTLLDEERLRFNTRQQEEAQTDLELVEGQIKGQGKALQDQERRCQEVEQELDQASGLLAFQQGGLEERRRRYQELLKNLDHLKGEGQGLEKALAGVEGHLRETEEAVNSLQLLKEEWLRKRQTWGQELIAHRHRLRSLIAQDGEITSRLNEVSVQRISLARERDETAALVRDKEMGLALKERERETLGLRHELLARMRQEGLPAAARSLIYTQEAGEGILPFSEQPVLMAQVLDVPAGLEKAIEAALCGHTYDIVVNKRGEAEAVIDFLKRTAGGNATLWPLDNVKESYSLNIIREPGVVGVASRLVKCHSRYRPVVDALLGRTIVVDNLAVAKRVVRRGMGNVATLAGEYLAQVGTITGGQPPEWQGTLAIEEEWRQLPQRLVAIAGEVKATESELSAARELFREKAEMLAQREDEEQHLRQEAQRVAQALTRHRLTWQGWRGERRGHVRATKAALGEEGALRQRLAALREERERLLNAKAVLEGEISPLLAQVREGEGELALLGQRAAEMASRDTSLRQEKEVLAAGRRAAESALNRLEERRQALRDRLGRLTEEEKSLRFCLAEAKSEADQGANQVRVVAEQLAAAKRRGEDIREEEEAAATQEAQLRARLSERERLQAVSQAEVSHRREGLEKLRDTMEQEGVIALEGELWQGEPEALKATVDRLKARLRALGPVNLEALSDYEETHSRYQFLTSQVRDLREASKSLQGAIAELEGIIHHNFQTTFETVSHQFKSYFTHFFGGGTAKLVRIPPSNGNEMGVELVAQPPGKRLQNLSLLSGGERALTAVAFLFAILEANPSPFCVLDEVDASLDETNSIRFSQALAKLCQRTQFIVITHNRNTMQVANTIYGVSMGEDNVSRVLSLRLEGDSPSLLGNEVPPYVLGEGRNGE